jgi:hypothetical protein
VSPHRSARRAAFEQSAGVVRAHAEAAVIGRYGTNVTDHVAMGGSNAIAVTADIHDVAGA